MTTTSQLRQIWAPPCEGPHTKVSLFGAGAVSVRPEIVDAVKALSACMEVHGYKSRKADTGAYNCRKITNGDGFSLHAYGIALDINWQSNPYGPKLVTDMPTEMVEAIKAIRTGNGKQVWRWGGDYKGNKDAMHFEVVCSPADLKTGIENLPEEDDMAGEGPEILQRIKEIQATQERQNEQLKALEEKVAKLEK